MGRWPDDDNPLEDDTLLADGTLLAGTLPSKVGCRWAAAGGLVGKTYFSQTKEVYY